MLFLSFSHTNLGKENFEWFISDKKRKFRIVIVSKEKKIRMVMVLSDTKKNFNTLFLFQHD